MTRMSEFLTENGGWVAGAVGALAAIAASLRQFSKTLAADKLEGAKVKAETDVVELLRTEWARAMVNNEKLAEQVTRLTAEWDRSAQSNRELSEQVEQLHALIIELRAEIAALKQRVHSAC